MHMDFDAFLTGWLFLGQFIVGLFFLRFWRTSKDRLFLLFGIAFWVLALQRIVVFMLAEIEDYTTPYLLRLLAFLIILYAIYDKNRPKKA